MRKFAHVFRLMLGFGLAGFSSPSVFAHHVGDGGVLDSSQGAGVLISASPMIEIGHSHDDGEHPPVQVLLAVSYRGFEWGGGPASDHPNRLTRYFWVSGNFVAADLGGDGKLGDAFQLRIVPVTSYFFDDQTVQSVRFLPTEIKRDVGAEINSSVTISAVGWSYQIQTRESGTGEPGGTPSPLPGEPGDGEVVGKPSRLPKGLVAFARIAVDALGVRFLDLGHIGAGAGFQPVMVSGSVGAIWDMTKEVTLRLSLGVRAAATVGSPYDHAEPVMITDEEAFARMEFLFRVYHAQIGAFVEGGIHGLSQFFPDDPSENHTHAHGYLSIGLVTQF